MGPLEWKSSSLLYVCPEAKTRKSRDTLIDGLADWRANNNTEPDIFEALVTVLKTWCRHPTTFQMPILYIPNSDVITAADPWTIPRISLSPVYVDPSTTWRKHQQPKISGGPLVRMSHRRTMDNASCNVDTPKRGSPPFTSHPQLKRTNRRNNSIKPLELTRGLDGLPQLYH